MSKFLIALAVLASACVDDTETAAYQCEAVQICNAPTQSWDGTQTYDVDATDTDDATALAQTLCDDDMANACSTGPSSCTVTCAAK